MKRKGWLAPVLAIGAILAVATFYVNRAVSPDVVAPEAAVESTGEISFLMEQQWLIKMKLAKAEQSMVARQITSTGRIVPTAQNHAVMAPPVGGTIGSDALPRIGQRVAQGQVLASVTQSPTAAESAQIRVENARIDAEKRRLEQASMESEVRLNLAKLEFDRATRLYERKAYSLRQLQAAEAEYKAAEANVGSHRQQLAALNESVAPTMTYTLRAPIAGTITAVHKSIGEQVNAGEAVFEVVNLNTVWLEAPVFERDLARLQADGQATFTTAAFPDREFTGRLVDIGSVIDEQTRAATAIFEVSNAAGDLRIGMQANVRFDAEERVDAVLIPKEAVLDNEGQKIVYVLISGEAFQRHEVQLGDEYGDKVAVLSGVTAGQRVVTQGAYQLKLQELRPAEPTAHTHEV